MTTGERVSTFTSSRTFLAPTDRSLQDASIDGLLRSLTDRPNVESTLILSRKDGSIIKTAGFALAEKRQRALSSAPEPTTDEANSAQDPAADAQRDATPAEELAASIYQFMSAAGALGVTLATTTARQDREDGSYHRNDPKQQNNEELVDVSAASADAEVQLLRLRVKQREIIIFPDSRYICCVVQRMGRQAGADGR